MGEDPQEVTGTWQTHISRGGGLKSRADARPFMIGRPVLDAPTGCPGFGVLDATLGQPPPSLAFRFP